MKKILLCLKKGIIIDIVFLAIGLLIGILIAHFAFHDTVFFYFNYTDSTVEVDLDSVISKEAIEKAKSIDVSWYTGSLLSKNDDGKTTYELVEISNIQIKDLNDGYLITVDKQSFNVSGSDKQYSDAVARGFLKHLVLMSLDQTLIDEYNQNFTYTNSKGKEILGITTIFDNDYYQKSLDEGGNLLNDHKETQAMIIAGSIGAVVGLFLGVGFCLIFIGKYDMEVKHEYDNEEIYRTPFHLSYFKKSLATFKNVKSLVSIALLLALVMISKFLWIPSGFSDLGIGFGYLFLAIACMMYGPVPSLVIGALSDVIGYLVKPDGAFFIGYTFQAMLACFTYGMLFYKTHITFSRVLLARVIVNLVCNVIIGSLCRAFIYSLDREALMTYMLTLSLPKNIVYLLPQSLLLFFVLKAVTVPMSAMNLINPAIAENISFF